MRTLLNMVISHKKLEEGVTTILFSLIHSHYLFHLNIEVSSTLSS